MSGSEKPLQLAEMDVVEVWKRRSAAVPSFTVPAAGGVASTTTPSELAAAVWPTPFVARTVT